MRDVYFRLVWRYEESISSIETSLKQIMEGRYATPKTNGVEWELVARDQVTGYFDCDGNEVIENDIFWNGKDDWAKVVVKFDGEEFYQASLSGEKLEHIRHINSCGYVKIGNIHERPHLMER